jgi:hypothetical protein
MIDVLRQARELGPDVVLFRRDPPAVLAPRE